MSVIIDYLSNKVALAIPVLSWYYLGNILFYYNEYNFKIARNIVSTIHALIAIFFYMTNFDVYFLYLISRGYYAVDTAYEVADLKRSGSIKLYQLGMLAHHFVTLYSLKYLISPLTSHYLYDTFFLAEVSNLPMYLMRHLRSKGYYNKYLIKGVTFLEFTAYLTLRMVLCVPIIYNVCINENIDIQLKVMTSAMYFLSGYWTYKMFGQLVN